MLIITTMPQKVALGIGTPKNNFLKPRLKYYFWFLS
jgi:hypothetical protein